MFGRTNIVSIEKEYKIESLFEDIIGKIEIKIYNKGQDDYGDLYIDNKLICRLYDDMAHKLFDIFKEIDQ